jgi:uncharacterized protein DUF222
VVLRGRLTLEAGALLLRALDAARETLYRRRRATEAAQPATDPAAEVPTRPQQQADALALLAETALHQELDPGAPSERYQVVVHVDAAVLADAVQSGQSVLEEGAHVSAETSRRLACDASRVLMRHDEDGRVVEVGARTRTIPPALRRALQHRDKTCRFPGCTVRIAEGHHVRLTVPLAEPRAWVTDALTNADRIRIAFRHAANTAWRGVTAPARPPSRGWPAPALPSRRPPARD